MGHCRMKTTLCHFPASAPADPRTGQSGRFPFRRAYGAFKRLLNALSRVLFPNQVAANPPFPGVVVPPSSNLGVNHA